MGALELGADRQHAAAGARVTQRWTLAVPEVVGISHILAEQREEHQLAPMDEHGGQAGVAVNADTWWRGGLHP